MEFIRQNCNFLYTNIQIHGIINMQRGGVCVHWSFEAEYIACIIIVILAFYAKERTSHMELQNTLFYGCLYMSLGSILLNIMAIVMMESGVKRPLWLLELLNVLYFVTVAVVEFLMTRYYLLLIHKNSVDKSCHNRARKVSSVLLIAYLTLVAFNFYTGFIFTISPEGVYSRGPGNQLIYVLFLIYLAMIVTCFVRQRRYVEQSMVSVMRIAPVVALFLATMQQVYQGVMMSGIVMAVSLLILFISFQSQKIHTDDLTGLYTREVFYYQLERLIQERRPFKAVIISARQFKGVNEKYGTRVGDQFLKQLADYIKMASEARGDAVVCRYAGVRFGVIFREIPETEFDRFLREVRLRFEEAWVLNEYRCRLPVNIAYMDRIFGEEDAGSMSACLDYAVEICKQKSVGRCVYFSEELYQAFRRQNKLVELIKRGMEEGMFYLNFQPVYDFKKGAFDSCEILLRLRDEEGNNVSPAEFIPLAEKRGLINELSWMIIDMACRFLSEHAEYRGSVSINFSVQQFLEPDIVQRMAELVRRYNVQPERIKIEITERIIAEDTKQVLTLMRELSSRGFGFYLDDFGTGYSSLAYVLTLPFESIKLDKSLVDGVGNERNRILVESMIKCFHAIGVDTVTEGVETEEQSRILRELGADKIQGYYYSRPLSEREFLELMAKKGESGCTE